MPDGHHHRGSSVGILDMTSKVIDSLGSPGVIFHGVTSNREAYIGGV